MEGETRRTRAVALDASISSTKRAARDGQTSANTARERRGAHHRRSSHAIARSARLDLQVVRATSVPCADVW